MAHPAGPIGIEMQHHLARVGVLKNTEGAMQMILPVTRRQGGEGGQRRGADLAVEPAVALELEMVGHEGSGEGRKADPCEEIVN